MKVQVKASGRAANLPHLMHLHDVLGEATSDCPPATSGDVVTVALSTDASMTLADIAGTAQVVVHGIDFDGNGEYAINQPRRSVRQPEVIDC